MSSVALASPDREPPRKKVVPFFGRTHSVASVARRVCRETHRKHAGTLLGGVACGACWEQAIRADERVVMTFGLSEPAPRDSSLIDEVAVERAASGECVPLTSAERRQMRSRKRTHPPSRAVLHGSLRERPNGGPFRDAWVEAVL